MRLFLLSSVLILAGCGLYSDKREIRVKNLGVGRVVISSSMEYIEIESPDSRDLVVDIQKGYLYSISFFPKKMDNYSRFPSGSLLYGESKTVCLSKSLGPLSLVYNNFHKNGYSFDNVCVERIIELLLKEEDPWIFYGSDIIQYVQGKIPLNLIRKKRVFDIPELELYKDWEPENPLFMFWYESLQKFYDPYSERVLRLEIHSNGDFTSFIEVN